MTKIEINGKKYKVIQTLPYHPVGRQARVVIVDSEEKVAVKECGKWRLWTVADRLRGY